MNILGLQDVWWMSKKWLAFLLVAFKLNNEFILIKKCIIIMQRYADIRGVNIMGIFYK